MGHVKTKPQVGQDGQPSRTTLFEITYGGIESPFGGIDSSAPPAYIDPRCFVSSDGFIIVDNKLCVASWNKLVVPTLFEGVSDVDLIKVGTFYNSKIGQVNYALGVVFNPYIGPPAATVYIYYLTCWNYNPISGVPVLLGTDVLPIQFFSASQAAVAASITVYPIPGEVGGFTDSGNVGLLFYNSGVSYGFVTVPYAPGTTLASVISSLITAINANPAYLVSATPTVDGTGIVLTALTPGAAGNLLAVTDHSYSLTPGNTPAFYFNTGVGGYLTNLQGGANAFFSPLPTEFTNVSTAEVGGVLYIANIGAVILKYSGPGSLAVSTAYNGQQVIRKFGGSLIGLGNIPQTGNIVQNSNMIFSWSAASELDVWSPINTAGNVTGAGFAQLADIGDYLTGLIVSNNTAFILRSEGISYATSQGSGSTPFQFAHIGLGDQGEGAQNSALVCQYDQTGAYVGNSDIFQISGTISAIGGKIKTAFYTTLSGVDASLGSAACVIYLGGDTSPVVIFVISNTVFLYNTDNQTWSVFTYFGTPDVGSFSVDFILLPSVNSVNLQFAPVIAFSLITEEGNSTQLAVLTEGVAGQTSISNSAYVVFPQEELFFGRDVTIDSLYISFFASIPSETAQMVVFYINGTQVNADGVWEPVRFYFSTVVLTSADYGAGITALPYELQVFPALGSLNAVFTAHSPQLEIDVVPIYASDTQNLLRFTKIMILGSIDPDQRPT